MKRKKNTTMKKLTFLFLLLLLSKATLLLANPSGEGTQDSPYNVEGVLDYINTLGADVESPKLVYVKGKISFIKEDFSTQFGNATFYISDNGSINEKEFYIFRTLYLGNKRFASGDEPIKVGDEVVICGIVQNYLGNMPETVANKSFIFSLNGKSDGGYSIYSILIDGIYYNLDSDEKTASVTCLSQYNPCYSGDVVIPRTVNYESVVYDVTSISDYAFYGCKFLRSISIPSSVKTIGDWAFQGCNLSSLIIGSGVVSIGLGNNYSVKTFWMGNTPPGGYGNAQGIINYVANESYNLSNRKIYPFLSSMFEVDGVKYVPVSPSDRTCDVLDCIYDSIRTSIQIDSAVVYRGVTMKVLNIQPYTCYKNTYYKEVTLNTLGSISHHSFYGCSSLETVFLGKNIVSIGESSFQDCTLLKKLGTKVFFDKNLVDGIELPGSLESVGNNAFSGCKNIRNVIMTDRSPSLNNLVLQLGSNDSEPLFSSCPLDSVYIGRNISYNTGSSYGYSPFYRNTSLRSVVITDKETEISPNEFYGCSNLRNVSIGDSVTVIDDYAFSGCSSLTHFSFGASVRSIGREAFSDCVSVRSITTSSTLPPFCGNQALDDINKWDCTLYVPRGYSLDYKAADQWKEFFFIEEVDIDNVPYKTGDVNGDGTIDVADISSVISYMSDNGGVLKEHADVNKDGAVDVADIATIISVMAGKGNEEEIGDDSITIDFNMMGFGNAEEISSLTLSDGTILTFDRGANKNAPKYYSSGTAIRIYPINTLSVTSRKSISSITLFCSANNAEGQVTASSGVVAVDDMTIRISNIFSPNVTVTNVHTDTGAASQMRVSSMTIVYAK